VTHLIFRNAWKYGREEDEIPAGAKQLDDDFFFHLFVSVPSLQYVCGLDICEALIKLNRKLGYDNFKLTVRVSKRHDGKRDVSWNEKYVNHHLKGYAGKIKRIWVSGPPAMNETLDRAFEVLGLKLKVGHTMIEVM